MYIDVLFGNKMISLKYISFIVLLSFCCININATQENSSNNGVILFSKTGFDGKSTIIKPGNYLINNLQDIKSIKIPNGYEIKLSNVDDYDNKSANIASYPIVDELNESKDIYTLDNIDISQYKYLYVLKVDLNNDDGIASHDECNLSTGKYFGRKITNMTEPNDKDKEKIIEITIDYSPDFQGLPDLKKYKNLKSINLLFNVLQNRDKSFVESEFNKIVKYINEVNTLTEIEIQGNLPSYYTVQNNKFFGFNLTTLPSIQNNIQEIYLINCSNLSSIDLSQYKELKKIYMYGNTFESASTDQWKKMIEQIYTLSTDVVTTKSSLFGLKKSKSTTVAKLTHVQLPRTFTGEIPKISNPSLSQIQYFSALGATSIAQQAFLNSEKLVEVSLPKVKEIKQETFKNNKSLKVVNIPKAEIIGKSSFEQCSSLNKVGDIKLINSNNEINLPNTISIADYAFKNGDKSQNKIITSIILPECQNIGAESFMRYGELAKLSVPKCISIGKLAFYDAYKLKMLEATSLETIGDKVFLYAGAEMRSFKTVNGKEEVSNYLEFPSLKVIGQQTFGGNKDHNIGTKILKLPECIQMADNAIQGSRITALEAPKISNNSKVLSLSNSNIVYNASLLK